MHIIYKERNLVAFYFNRSVQKGERKEGSRKEKDKKKGRVKQAKKENKKKERSVHPLRLGENVRPQYQLILSLNALPKAKRPV